MDDARTLSRLMRAAAFVISLVLIGGVLGGLVGREVGLRSPAFVRFLASGPPSQPPPAGFDPAEFGLGLGTICGLFLGVGIGLFLVVAESVREIALARARAVGR